jgi:pyruvate decarboxylase
VITLCQGVPSTTLQAKKAILHHTLGGSGNFNSFAEMSSHISSTIGILKKEGNWTEEIDRVLTVALTECRPVYLTLPTDLVHSLISDERLKKHALPRPHSAPPSKDVNAEGNPSSDVLKFCIDEIAERFKKSKKPIVIVDICADRFGCGPELKRLVETTEVRFFASE